MIEENYKNIFGTVQYYNLNEIVEKGVMGAKIFITHILMMPASLYWYLQAALFIIQKEKEVEKWGKGIIMGSVPPQM